ncbi:hypothetical protein GE061_010003 [Apolygus lucorum]|uniref:SWIM-type domain-containing protein n=1 Tax=Apolygus lucorum TaxID=248454 RepID=A0A8S9Y3X1_APOLU|nr:hypothetical protein GE061_010003 [Apolygus lucorum]
MSVKTAKLSDTAVLEDENSTDCSGETVDEEVEFEKCAHRVTPGKLKAKCPFCLEKFQDYPSRNHHLKNNCSRRMKSGNKAKEKKPSVEYELYIEEDSEPTCQVCRKSFRTFASRNRHMISTHNSIKNEHLSPRFVIDVEEEYSRKVETRGRKKRPNAKSRCGLLRRKTVNTSKDAESAGKSSNESTDWILHETVRCQEEGCSVTFPFVQDLRNHLVMEHCYQPLFDLNLEFSSLQEFEDWKKKVEEESETKWVKHHTKTFELYRVIIYDCIHMIRVRSQGVTDSHCTSQIILKAPKGNAGRLKVTYFPGHYGHDHLALRLKWEKFGRESETSQSKVSERKVRGRKTSPRKIKRDCSEEDSSERTCDICEKTFLNTTGLDKHVKRFHDGSKYVTNDKGPIECLEPDCGKKFRVRRFLRAHLLYDHNIEMQIKAEALRFSTKEEFDEWKNKIEEETQSYYRIRQQFTNKTYKKTIQYLCCRSGKMVNTDNRKRPLKIQGSRRSNINCTSEIRLRYLDQGFQVEYFKDHYAHDNSLAHLPVPKKVKEEIKEKLMAGQDVGSILRELRNSASSQVSRKHVLRKKDVYNIQQSIGPAGECFEELNEADLVVVIMTPFQRQMALKFGNDRICVDSTYDELAPEKVCELTTILAVNEFEEAIPLAFCLSSKVNMNILKLFFTSVRDVIGTIACHTFVGIEAPQFYDAWRQIMGTPQCHVMCAWHIDSAWKLKLGRLSDRDKRFWIYDRLKACQLQVDINEFSEMFQSLIYELYQNEDTKYIYTYINEYYNNRPELWANAHRIGIKINTNLYLDNFHRSIRRSFLKGRDKPKVDKCITAINDYILDREYDQLAEYCRRKVLMKINDISSCHVAGMALVPAVCTIIDASCWAVSSSSQDLIYVVNKVEKHKCDSSCVIYCQQCTACLKGYTCSCDDNAISGNICKHLHAVAGYQMDSREAIQYIKIDGNDDVVIAPDDVIAEGDREVIIGQVEESPGKQEQVWIAHDGAVTVDDREVVIGQVKECQETHGEMRTKDTQCEQILDKYSPIIDDDYEIIINDSRVKEHQIIGNDERILMNDDDIIINDDYDEIVSDAEQDGLLFDNDDVIIDTEDEFNDNDEAIIESEGHDSVDMEVEQFDENGQNQDIYLMVDEGDQIARQCDDVETDFTPSENSEVTRLDGEDLNSKSDLVSTALQLMGDLAGFEDNSRTPLV